MITARTIKKDFKDAVKDVKNLEKAIPKAMSSALNRVGTGVRTDATKATRESYTVKAGDVRQDLKIDKSRVRSDMTLIIDSRGANLPLTKFKTSHSKRYGVRANVKKSTGLKVVAGAFMMSKKPGIFSRVRQPRLPIKELYGPAVPVMLNNDKVTEQIEEKARTRMVDRFDHEINRVMGRIFNT